MFFSLNNNLSLSNNAELYNTPINVCGIKFYHQIMPRSLLLLNSASLLPAITFIFPILLPGGSYKGFFVWLGGIYPQKGKRSIPSIRLLSIPLFSLLLIKKNNNNSPDYKHIVKTSTVSKAQSSQSSGKQGAVVSGMVVREGGEASLPLRIMLMKYR